MQVYLGNNILIPLQLSLGETNQYPQVLIYNSAGTLLSTNNMTHKANGFYYYDWTPTAIDNYVCIFKIYTDAAHIVLSTTYGISEDSIEVLGPVYVPDPVIPAGIYSTVGQLRNNIKSITTSVMDDASVTQRIAMADNIVETDLSKIVDFDSLPSPIPIYINLLSQYKTCELSLAYCYSLKRLKESDSDIGYWKDMYDNLLAKILAGEIDVGVAGLGVMDFENTHRTNIRPALGQNEYGEFANDDTIEDFRESYGGDSKL